MRKCLLLILYTTLFCSVASAEKEDCTDLARDEETLLVFSTLGGGLTAIDPITSDIRWTIDDEPAVKATQKTDVPLQQYLPDPRDGSLYQLGDMGDLKKLPYTIPQLVANAPCRSSDGILYSGKKSDTWFLIDPKTGKREKVMGFGSMDRSGTDESIGWATSRSVYLGRTQYTVMMYDSLSKNKNSKPWNITFYDYASHTMAPEISSDYEYVHLAGSSTGLTVTLNRIQGKLIWQKDFTSPVIAVFLLGSEGLLSVPFTTVSDDALRNIIEEAKEGTTNEIKLFHSLYVGEHPFGLYAIPSLIDKNTATISSDPPVKLLEGPHGESENDAKQNLVYLNDFLQKEKDVIVLGHYQLPKTDDEHKITISPSNTFDNKQLATIVNLEFLKNKNNFIIVDEIQTKSIGVQTNDDNNNNNNNNFVQNNNKNKTNRSYIIDPNLLNYTKAWLTDYESGGIHQMLVVLILIMMGMFVYTCSAVRELKQSQNSSKTMNNSSGNSNISNQDLIDLGDGEVQVGKITFNCTEILGKGCEGTFVFKGTFEERKVAVKRLLPECFTFADREVALLRESDEHENVVRYFCTEQDRQFRYIAVELCAATLQDYTEGELSENLRIQINVWDVLKQATKGLAHLHSLNIVHRDIKPQNVLISLPDNNNSVKAMISDFGLCKKLNYGRTSFSRRSGITGTEGWIAPEMLKGQRTTTSVDIFSLGCVFFYVLTKGLHAFGDTLKRQANILSNEYDLNQLTSDDLKSDNILAQQLIADMIHYDSQRRPSAQAVCNHPVFWNEEKILAFLQDVSDRIEKLQFTIEPLKTLEKNGRLIVKDDWNLHLDTVISADLRKYRDYMGGSVRDLLRALRNKRHHYHELPDEAQTVLGNIPHDFINYWITKFPYLLSHAYHALSICSNENPFKIYYDISYQFTKPNYFYEIDTEQQYLFADNKKLIHKEKIQKTRKNFYNFYNKNNNNNTNCDENNLVETNENTFVNFKFRNKSIKSKNNNGRQKTVVWTLPEKDHSKDED